jgi:osmotically-inducible protein OsmY
VTPTDIKMKIEEALKRSAEMDARRITVEVSGGLAAPGVSYVENLLSIMP